MAKNRSVTFGDIIIDKSTGIRYVAFNGTEAVNKRRLYVLCLELNDKNEFFHKKPPIPFDRVTVREFHYIDTMQSNIEPYLTSMGFKYKANSVSNLGFTVKV